MEVNCQKREIEKNLVTKIKKHKVSFKRNVFWIMILMTITNNDAAYISK